MTYKTIPILFAVFCVMITAASARDQIRVVGSSTVFPFSTAVAENFGRITKFKTPVIESTGTGGGAKLFCSGLGTRHPDITNASRRIKRSEINRCAKNGISKIIEIQFGFDGIVIANTKSGGKIDLDMRHVFLALAKKVPIDAEGKKLVSNPHKRWSDIDPSLPNIKIEVLGPPPTSGTRDAFVELAMEGGCKTFKTIKAMKKRNKKKYKALCHGIREDGVFIDAGENDNLIVQKLNANPNAFGIFGFSFLDQNSDSVKGASINGIAPTFENITSGKYKISRSLYFYIKKAHIGVIPGLRDFVKEFTSEKSFGDEGYLVDKGLIPLSKEKREKARSTIETLKELSMQEQTQGS
ncbi:MAG: phosphate ABC transporter substrate-binding protein [Rhodospirillaceae bacterium]|nr:phosphate ABC transporter substrate-binding protein [Rhodospirillaceae bacterium]|tara:strand:- start:16601 stop:17659 length:1059 start_codon:yes stop_codon:yes gene_type:complete